MYVLPLENHKNTCLSINGQQSIKMPNKDEKVFFKNYHKQQANPFIIYADLEAILQKISGCQSNPENVLHKLIKHTHAVLMVTKLYAAMMRNIQNQFKFIEVTLLFKIYGKTA